MAHSIDEVRRLTAAARKYKVVTQLGNQGHSGEGIRRFCEYIWAGAIGNVTETYSWAPTGRGGVGGRLPTKPVPAGLHWDEWIGPAHFRDYHDRLHPGAWRTWWEFGDASVGDWGCHNLDGPYTGPGWARRQRRGPDARRRLGGTLPAGKRDSLGLPRPRRHAAGKGVLVRRISEKHRPFDQGRRRQAGEEDPESAAHRGRVREEVRPRFQGRGDHLRGREGHHVQRQLDQEPGLCPRRSNRHFTLRRRRCGE